MSRRAYGTRIHAGGWRARKALRAEHGKPQPRGIFAKIIRETARWTALRLEKPALP